MKFMPRQNSIVFSFRNHFVWGKPRLLLLVNFWSTNTAVSLRKLFNNSLLKSGKIQRLSSRKEMEI